MAWRSSRSVWLVAAAGGVACGPAAPNSITPTALEEAPGAAPPTSASPAPTCAARISNSLEAWRREMLAVDHQRADASEVYAELLARLRLEPLPEVEHLGSDEPTWSLRGVELRDAALAPDAGFVMALASFEYGAFARALRAPIFRKDVDGLCLVSDALSREIDGRSCLAEGEPFSVRLLPLLGARVQTIELTVLSGRCDGYSVSRGAHHELELWALQPAAEPAAPDALEKLLGLTTFDAWYTSPLPPLRVEETDVSYVGDPPQAVVADTRVTCDRWPEHSVEEECEASATHTEYRYVKGRYLSVP